MRPLEGIKIIELAEYVALPAAPRMLADWGATVYKVEKPSGDPQRTLGHSFNMIDFQPLDYNHCLDMSAGGNKEYLSLNLKDPEGMEAFHRLLADADVLATSWRTKALRKLGLTYDQLKERYPRLVYAQIVGYGDEGDYKDEPGFDAICYSARGSIMRSLPQEGDAPANCPPAFGDFQASVAIAAGICGALLQRDKTGHGDRVSVSLYHTAIYMMSIGLVSSTYSNKYPTTRKLVPNPFNNSYPTRDGSWLLICLPVYDVSFNRVMKLIGREDLVDSPVYSRLGKVKEEGRITEIVEIIEEGFRTRTVEEWMAIFKAEDIPGGKCFTMEDILHDELAWENHFLREMEYPHGVTGVVTDTPVRFDGMGLPPLRQSKPLGFHTEEILRRYGYTQEQLDAMRASGAIRTAP